MLLRFIGGGMQKIDKQNWVKEYKEVFHNTDFAFVFRCERIPSEDMLAIRGDIKTSGGKVAFVKNTLARIAATETGCESIVPLFKGVSVLVTPKEVGDMDTYPAIVKSIASHMKTKKDKLVFAGGVLQGKFLDKSALEEFGKMPTRAELLGRIAFLCQYPLVNVADTIKRAGESK